MLYLVKRWQCRQLLCSFISLALVLYGIESCSGKYYVEMVDAQLSTWGKDVPRETLDGNTSSCQDLYDFVGVGSLINLMTNMIGKT